ncbi:Asp-tRNA(Asn)/Glu-tRNA(Gln) amidotransferase subunit GatC [Flammeovirgaceae bacterium SG7u.111]|nr:Asp-tRNA(Asn)/Glu-tRNA(Gln) amidotransferase subunit GatC [Flammeovirgaceae bacterium SG7u.132]WPO38785.1 Asp-tRNA(Asn)/Glu-tRNA(Gln) amidotransferase subunit GatC [Flammeovirgaceae bacterium SG7u.111]
MKVDNSTLEKIAHLSRLYLDEKEEGKMLESLNEIVEWMDKLREVDTENVEPQTHMTREVNILREDKVIEHLPREQGLVNAPKHDGEYFRVPKVKE